MLQQQVDGCEALEDSDVCLQCLTSRMQVLLLTQSAFQPPDSKLLCLVKASVTAAPSEPVETCGRRARHKLCTMYWIFMA